MFKKKYDLAIINRSFWPDNKILGEAKLRLAEEMSRNYRVCVIAQSALNLQQEARDKNRGKGIRFFSSKSRSNSSSHLLLRIADAFVFSPYVFLSLCRARPKHVYVSTNPPVVVPFIAFLYCFIFRAEYTYHLQDIHPEITNIIIPINKLLFGLLRKIDNIAIRNAREIITLSEDMAHFIRLRSKAKIPIHLITNPAFDLGEPATNLEKKSDIVFCGNAGRLQLIPTLVEAIAKFLEQGGNLTFTFVGSGVNADKLRELALKYEQVSYLGYLQPDKASRIVAEHRWALLPLKDEVTKYAFPSKSTSYLIANCRILGICGPDTSLARWITENGHGISVAPEVDQIVTVLWQIQLDEVHVENPNKESEQYTIAQFVNRIVSILKPTNLRGDDF
ncbi:hypothetical protein IDAT_05960 [Pseudidiomarina atlantica]|uniref:Glycosyltransferase n=1 Tax=Pseudidiomarina atlantica TaxID=1517416 RepID=A0A094ITR2_9GAMM|nr:hypothetical protein [Pseudidiomarina atlantica]KFZ29214.1 hypothetical protein IDAT_05960 [Pseudidiomarina atlantica]